MKEYTVSLNEAEDLALSYVAASQDAWITHAVRNRCRVAMDELAQFAINKCFETGIQVPGSKEELVQLAFANGWVKSAAQREQDFQALLASKAEAAQQEG